MQWSANQIENTMNNRNGQNRDDDKENPEENEEDERPPEDVTRNDEQLQQELPHEVNHHDINHHDDISHNDTITHDEDSKKSPGYEDEEDLERQLKDAIKEEPMDPKTRAQLAFIQASEPTTELEIALSEALKRKEVHIERLSGEVHKLKAFISKRKQTYKRKRKDEGAPTRALSAYNIFVQDRFAALAKQNEDALNSADTDAVLKRVPPANLVASTGNQWKELSAEEKSKYEER
jgi:hypothetical protein